MLSDKTTIIATVATLLAVTSLLAFTHRATKQYQQDKNDELTVNGIYLGHFTHIADLQLKVGEFKQWMTLQNKQYIPVELQAKFLTWNNNYNIVQEHNAKNLSWTLGMNQFADLSTEEFAALHLGLDRDIINNEDNQVGEDTNNAQVEEEIMSDGSLGATSLDWRTKGAVGYIRNQAQCGACWAFAAATALEALYFQKKGTLPNLSEQQLVDCSSAYGNQGCNGGLMTTTYQYTKANGIGLEADYPYTAVRGSCRYSTSKSAFKNTGHITVTASNPTQLLNAVNKMPVSVGMRADQSTFQLYKSGIITSNCASTGLNHAITIVGYATSGSTDYWIARNQWGTNWGDSGYVKIARGTQNNGAGVCGINLMASYPTA